MDFDYVFCVKIVRLVDFVKDEFLGDVFVFVLALAIILFIGSMRVF